MSATTTLKAILVGEDRSMSRTVKGAGKEADTTKKKMGHLRGELGKLGKGSGSLKGVMSGAFKDIGGAASGLGMAGGPLGMVAGGVLAIGAAAGAVLAPFAKDSVETFKRVATEVNGLRRIMGATPEDASRMRFAFKETGVDATKGSKAVALFSKKLDAAGSSSKTHAKMVHDLGFEYLDARGKIRPMADLLPQVADRFSKMPDGANKTALAMKLFGKSGTDLLPFLNRGAAGLEELSKKSDEYGETLSGKNLQALKDSKESQKDWDAAVEGLKIRFGAELLPMLTKVVNWLRQKVIPALVKAGKWWESHQEVISRFASVVGTVLGAMWKVVSTYFKLWWKAIQIVGNAFIWLWNKAFQPALQFIVGGVGKLLRIWAGMLRALSNVPGFGWAKKAADKMDGAADKADAIAASIKKIPTSKDVTVYIRTSGRIRLPDGTTVNVGQRAGGGSTIAGKSYLVGENGPEIWSEDRSGRITPARQTAQILAGPAAAPAPQGGYDGPEVVQLVVDGRVLQEVLLRRKRQTGRALGLA